MRFDLLHPADQLVMMMSRIYYRGMTTTSGGNLSIKDADGSVWITPSGVDKGNIGRDDIMRVRSDGTIEGRHRPSCRTERGKQASRATHLHEEIYRRHSDINSILVAQPLHLMAFAVTGVPFDVRTIPESYVVLRDIHRIPYGTSLSDSAETARRLSSRTPVLVCENECVIVTGTSLLNAFDRLEVAEFTARSIIGSAGLGPIVHMAGPDIEDIRVTFGL